MQESDTNLRYYQHCRGRESAIILLLITGILCDFAGLGDTIDDLVVRGAIASRHLTRESALDGAANDPWREFVGEVEHCDYLEVEKCKMFRDVNGPLILI